MWPFKKKKKEDKDFSFIKEDINKSSMPNAPPSIRNKEDDFGEIKKAIDKPIPRYEGGLNHIKNKIDSQINSPGGVLDIPKRKPSFLKKKRQIESNKKLDITGELGTTSSGQDLGSSSNPIFVKLKDYRSARDNLEKIKELTKQAENLLTDLNETREEEDKELDKWKSDIEKIKNNLLIIDKKLFEL